MRLAGKLVGSWIAFAALGCDEAGPPRGGPAPSAASSASAAPQVVSAAASAAPAPSAAAPPTTTAAGHYEGSYSPTTPTIALEAGVKVPEWKPSGEQEQKGRLVLDVDGAGRVTGVVEGVLGPATIEGRAEGDDVTGTIVPRDPDAGMHGTLVGTLRGKVIEGELRAASGDARAVRRAEVSLTRTE